MLVTKPRFVGTGDMSVRHVLVSLFAVGLGLAAVSASAQDRPWIAFRRPPPPPAPACSVSVEDESGRPLRTFSHQGRTYVLGEEGTRYHVRVDNRTDGRVEAVLSIDGRDAINGRVGDYVRNRGYVVQPHGTVLVQGFRQSLEQVASFRFASPRQSYSARMGTPQNVGVIGVACFTERAAPVVVAPPPEPWWGPRAESAPDTKRRAPKSSSGRGAPGRPAPADDAAERDGGGTYNLGTEYGESRYAPVSTTSFERASASPRQVTVLHYDDAAGLEARGIRVYWYPDPRPVEAFPAPTPFPGSGFAPPPP